MLGCLDFALRRGGVGLAGIVVGVSSSGAVGAPVSDSLQQHAYLKAGNAGAFDNLGLALGISGQLLVVGAPGEGSATHLVNGNGADDSAFFAGAAYVFVRSGVSYAQLAYLKASNAEAGDGFGGAVAISGDTLVIGADHERSSASGIDGNASDNSAPNAGAAYVFVKSGLSWIQQAYLKPSNTEAEDRFGGAVAIAGDTIVIGARGEDSSATSVNGNAQDNNASGSGAVYVFVRSGTTWTQQAYLKAANAGMNDAFGAAVAIASETVVIGAPDEDGSGTTVNGASDEALGASGAAYVFVRKGTTWTQQAYLKADQSGVNDRFGSAVAIAGNTVLVGAPFEDGSAIGVNGTNDEASPNSGAAYSFVRSGTTWIFEAYLKATNTGMNDAFGSAVAFSGDTAVIGAPFESSAATGIDGNGASEAAPTSGAVYEFTRAAGTWGAERYVKASNCGAGDRFGAAVAISGTTFLAGAGLEDSNSSQVNGDGADNTWNAAGAAYVFGTPLTLVVTCTKATLKDKSKPGKDSLSLSGSIAFAAPSPDLALDPIIEGATIHGGAGTGSVRLDLPAGSGWKAMGTKRTFKSPLGAVPKIDFSLDTATGAFSVKASKFDFPSTLSTPAGITLTLGNDGGTWFATFKDPKQHTQLSYP